MPEIPSARQAQILKWLREREMLTIDEIVAQLGVSIMTVHRDLDVLEQSGVVEKVHGGVILASSRPLRVSATAPSCKLCDASVSARTTFVIQLESGEQCYACCPHCGFLMLNDIQGVVSVLARDFIYGRMVNAGQATFLLESDITLCCAPSVLCFSGHHDAARFQQGFNGHIMTFAEAQIYLLHHHRNITE